MTVGEHETQYNRRYHLQRALKPILHIDSHKKRIDIPEGMELGKTDQKRVDALVENYGYVIQKVLSISPFEKVMIYNSMGIQGINIRFREDKMIGYKPGTKILKIGKGPETRNNAIDIFKLPAVYAGTIMIDNRKYYALQLNQSLFKRKDQDYYLLYEITKQQIIREVYKEDGSYELTRFYYPEFKLLKPEPKRPGKQNKLNFND
ncbi:hypothetical protein ACX0HA_08820 [Flavobacterium hauense]